jgi:peptidyl-prolyl cis-trans isomerase SurA
VAFKNILSRSLTAVFAALVFAFLAVAPARAQEEVAPVVLDEPIVQVNADVVLLSHLKRENGEFKDVLTKRGMTPEQADAEIAKKQPEIIFNLINEALLLQRSKDIPRLTEEIEAEVNREVLRVAKQSGLSTLEELEEAMKREGLSLSEIKETLRRQFTRQAVLQREVDAKIYYNLTDADLHKYYDANRSKFASVTISEIFLSLAGRSEADVKAKAADLVARARTTGADFGDLAVKNSEREQNGVRVAEKTKGLLSEGDGKPRWFLISDLQPSIAEALKDVKAGGVSEPIKTDEGYLILRINDRDDSFKENFVRGMITAERADKAHEEYLTTLRKEAYIKPAESYKEVLTPLLEKDKQQTASKQQESPAPEKAPAPEKKEKDKNKKQ